MKNIIIILFFISISTSPLNLITIDLKFSELNFYRVKNIDTNINFSFNNQTTISLMPKNYVNLIQIILKNNKYFYNCHIHNIIINKINYENFFCEKNIGHQNLNQLKLVFDFEKDNITIKESELFSKEGKYYYFNFWTNDNVSDIVLSKKLLNIKNDNSIFMRKLEEENRNNDNYNNITHKNDTNSNQKNINDKSSIGWLGICFIIILSIIVIYVLYVLFRYYRRKKYQNPSFYYKITEEMFDDITPIE